VPLPPEAVERRRRTALELNLAQYMPLCSRPGGSRPWSDDELALLGTMPDKDLACRVKRTPSSVRQAREKRDIAPPDGQRAHKRTAHSEEPWTPEDDDLVMHLGPREAAEYFGRTLKAIYERRKVIKRARRGGG
jgi:hypothetical protein